MEASGGEQILLDQWVFEATSKAVDVTHHSSGSMENLKVIA